MYRYIYFASFIIEHHWFVRSLYIYSKGERKRSECNVLKSGSECRCKGSKSKGTPRSETDVFNENLRMAK